MEFVRRLHLARWAAATAVLGSAIAPWSVGAASAAVGSPTSGLATACPRPLPAAAMAKATAVFTGVVESSAPSGARISSQVAVDRVYKGSLASSTVLVVTGTGPCGLGRLKVDERYVVMVSVQGDQLVAGGGSGTAVASDQLLGRVQAVLGPGLATGTQPAATEVTFSSVDDSSPTPVLRAAAPGLALALVGLLGWVAARRFA